MRWIRYYWHKLTKFKYFTKNLDKFREDTEMPENIYNTGPTLKEFVKKGNRIHKWAKYIVLVPFLHLIEWALGKYIDREVPDKPYYKNLKMLDDAYNQAIIEWCDIGRLGDKPNHFKNPAKSLKGMLKSKNSSYLRLLKDIGLTMARNDTAYLEFLNMLLLNLYVKMHEYHKGSPEHILYTGSDINQPKYFTAVNLHHTLKLKRKHRMTKDTKKGIVNRRDSKYLLDLISAELCCEPREVALKVKELVTKNDEYFGRLIAVMQASNVLANNVKQTRVEGQEASVGLHKASAGQAPGPGSV